MTEIIKKTSGRQATYYACRKNGQLQDDLTFTNLDKLLKDIVKSADGVITVSYGGTVYEFERV